MPKNTSKNAGKPRRNLKSEEQISEEQITKEGLKDEDISTNRGCLALSYAEPFQM